MMRLRQSTAEPVIGTLIEYAGMGKLYTKGIKLANKCMLMAAMSYNLKKLLKTTGSTMLKRLGRAILEAFSQFLNGYLLIIKRQYILLI